MGSKPRHRPGKRAQRKQLRKRKREYLVRVLRKRLQDLEVRYVDTDQTCIDEDHGPISPFLAAHNNYIPWNTERISKKACDFYELHQLHGNPYLEVSTAPNVANPDGNMNGQWGVFAKAFIPSGTCVCPYLGAILDSPNPYSSYVIRLDKGCYIDALRVKWDIGYLLCNALHIAAPKPCDPNYGRYMNTIDKRVPEQRHLSFNVAFHVDEDGFDEVWIYAKRDIQRGEEVLVNYGIDWNYWFEESRKAAQEQSNEEEEEEVVLIR